MEMISPLAPVYQTETLSGNPLAVSAGFEVLQQLEDVEVYVELEKKGEFLRTGISEAACLISFIRMLSITNTFLFKIMKQNDIQMIAPGHRIPREITSRFNINYLLNQEILQDGRLRVVVKDVLKYMWRRSRWRSFLHHAGLMKP